MTADCLGEEGERGRTKKSRPPPIFFSVSAGGLCSPFAFAFFVEVGGGGGGEGEEIIPGAIFRRLSGSRAPSPSSSEHATPRMERAGEREEKEKRATMS